MFVSNLLAMQSAVQSRDDRSVLAGLIVPGSWSAATGTAQVMMLNTYAILDDTGDMPVIVQAHQMSGGLGDQYAPVGNECVHLHRTDEGWAYQIIHGDNESPGVPSGERWIMHRNQSGTYNSYIKLTNDGAISGDGNGGLKLGFGELAEIETAGGHSIVCNDSAKTITITSAGGLTIVLNDNTTAITFGPAGATFQFAGSGTTSGDAVVRQSDLQTAITSTISNTQTALTTLAARCQGGSGVATSTISAVTAGASSKTFTA